MNNFADVGRIGKDAVVRHTQGGDSVTGFSVAVDSGYGDKKTTLWLDCSMWGKRGDAVAPYLLKGSQVFVQGELGTREHDGKTYLTLRVGELKLVGSKPDSAPKRQATGGGSVPHGDEAFPEDSEIPFVTQYSRY